MFSTSSTASGASGCRIPIRHVQVAVALGFTACQPAAPDAEGPPLPDSFSASGTAVMADRWWQSFDDPRLNRLEKQALGGNFSLESSWQRLQQAVAVSQREGADLFPDLDALAGAHATRLDRNGEQWDLGLAASYEVDLWGGIRSRVEAEQLRARAGLADYRRAEPFRRGRPHLV